MALDFPSSPTVGQVYASAGLQWVWDGAKWINASVGSLSINVQRFTAVGTNTYTPSANLVTAIVECQAGGGGGGGAAGATGTITVGGGGASGGFSRRTLTAAQVAAVGTTVPVTVGGGGSGGVGAAAGTAGGNSSFATLCVANGGAGGNVANAVAAAGAAPGVGDIAAAGEHGGAGWQGNASTSTTAVTYSGMGGSSHFGGGATCSVTVNGAVNGNSASNYGSGGSGAVAHNTTASGTGGAGSPGLVLITEFIGAPVAAAVGGGGGGAGLLAPSAVQVFTSSGTYTPSGPGVTLAIVECIGGGGAGGSANATGAGNLASGSGGGSGGYSRKIISAPTSQPITIGAGGLGASGVGNNGGDTSFGSVCVAHGGLGGPPATYGTSWGPGGAGGASGVGDIVVAGNAGNGGSYGVGGVEPASGGCSYLGGAATGPVPSINNYVVGVAASGYGSGGSGAFAWTGTGTAVGGNGSPGICIVTEYGTVAAFSTGDVKLTFKTTADPGWVMMNDGSVGNASSGATTLASATTQALFTLFYNNCADADVPIQTAAGAATTRAAQGTAAAAFAASCRLVLPKALGRALAGAGTGAGMTARPLGSAAGAETHTQTGAELLQHNHLISDPSHAHGVSDPGHVHSISDPSHTHTTYPLVSAWRSGSTFGVNNVVAYLVDELGVNVGVNAAYTGITQTNLAGAGIGVAGALTGINNTVVTGGSAPASIVQPTSYLNVMVSL